MSDTQSKIQIWSTVRIFHYKKLNIHFFVVTVRGEVSWLLQFSLPLTDPRCMTLQKGLYSACQCTLTLNIHPKVKRLPKFPETLEILDNCNFRNYYAEGTQNWNGHLRPWFFQAKIYAILACAYEIQSQKRPEKYVSICSDSQVALKALQAIRTTSPLVQQWQRALSDISTQHAVGLYWVPGHAAVRGNEIADELAKGGSGRRFLGPEPVLGVSRQDIQRRLGRWLVNQHWVRWRGLGDTQRQARELISGPSLGAKAKSLSFNRTQSRAVTGLLTGHNTLRRHLHLLGLVHCVGSVEWKRKPRPTFFVNVRPWPHSDLCFWVPFSWSQRILRA
jgi:hypothetical protein